MARPSRIRCPSLGEITDRSGSDNGPAWPRAAFVVFLLYAFLVGVKALESGINGLGSGFTDALFEGVSNPFAALAVGILGTVLVQSSSVSTATIVGLVGAGTLGFEAAVPMIMGANLGTTITNTLVSTAYLRPGREFRRAFAGATMHDFFNLTAVAVLLPIELATGVLARSATWLTSLLRDSGPVGIEQPDSPIKVAVSAPVRAVSNLLADAGLSTGAVGGALLVLGLGLILLALSQITRNMRLLMVGRIERSLNAVLARGAGVPAIAVGIVMTVAVQSSSITTSILIPLIAAGVLTLPNAFPVTVGANLGTTVTALLASLATARPEGLAIALVHLLFNASGILLIYPIPAIRRFPMALAEGLARIADGRRYLAIVYVVGGFIVLPLVVLLVLR
jgi:solute carrier family 34 (sodium-dependent phosphate cotransporter)